MATYLKKAIELVDRQLLFVERQMLAEQTDMDCPLKQKSIFGIKLKWTHNIVDYVEWMYGLHEILNVAGAKVSLTKLFNVFNPVFGIKLTSFSQFFAMIKNRKKGERTTFLDKQKKLLTLRIEEADK